MNNFEQHIKDQMQNFAPTPPPAAWAGVSSGMGTSTAAKVGAKLLMKWIAGILITGGVVTTAVIYTQSDSTQQNNQVQQKETFITSPEKISQSSSNQTPPSSNENGSSGSQNLNSNSKQTQRDPAINDGGSVKASSPKGYTEYISSQNSLVTTDMSDGASQKNRNESSIVPPAKINLSDYTLCPDQMLNVQLSDNCQGCSINWGDGESEPVNASEVKHSYHKEGKYIIGVNGTSEIVTVKKSTFNVDASLINSTTVLYRISNPDNLDLTVQFDNGPAETVNKNEIKHTLSEGEINAKFSTNSACAEPILKTIKSNIVQPLVPNVFTPNGDGSNDKYEIDFKHMALKFFHIEVIDIKGKTVFESFSPTEGWEGTYKNEVMPEGTYTMQLMYQFEQLREPEKAIKTQILLRK